MASPEKIILHCGLPKTGTTAMQNWCAENREKLLEFGVDYPAVEIREDIGPITNDRTPKHGILIGALRSGNMDKVKALISGAEAPVLLLSTEGLSNHFYKFPEENLAKLRECFAGIPVELFLVYRDKPKWLKSLWNQAIISYPGTPATFEEYAQLPIVRRLADWEQLKADMMESYGASHVEEVTLEENGWRIPLMDYLNIEDFEESESSEGQHNVSLGSDVLEFIRQMNQMRLGPNVRLAMFGLIHEIYNTSNLAFRNAGNWTEKHPGHIRPLDKAIRELGPVPDEDAEKVRQSLLTELEKKLNPA